MSNLKLIALLSSVMLLAPGVRADNGDVKQQIKVEYMRTDEAIRSRDLDRAMNHYTKDFELKVGGKILDRKQVATYVHWQIVATKEIKELAFAIQSISVKGSIAVVVVKQTQSMVVYKNQTRYLLESKQVSEDTWIMTPDGWRLKYQEVKHNETTVDGRPVPQITFVPLNIRSDYRAA